MTIKTVKDICKLMPSKEVIEAKRRAFIEARITEELIPTFERCASLGADSCDLTSDEIRSYSMCFPILEEYEYKVDSLIDNTLVRITWSNAE